MSLSSAIAQELERAMARETDCPGTLGSFLVDLLKGDLLPQVLNDLLTVGLDTNYLPLGDVGSESIVLVRTSRVVMQLKFVREKRGVLHSVGADSFTAFKTDAPVTIDRYRISGENVDLSVFQPGVPITLVDSKPYEGGVIQEKRREPIIYDYYSDQPFVIAKISLRPASDQIWFFDRETMKSTFPALGYNELSGCILLCRMVGALQEKRALPLMLELTDHPSHFVRWAAIQALGKLDGAIAYEHLEKAAKDKHPHISSAASKMLSRLAR